MRKNILLAWEERGERVPQMRTMTDLQDIDAISLLCHERKEPIFITKNGDNDLVIMSAETYDAMLKEVELDHDIAEAEAEYRRERLLLDAKDSMTGLRRKYFG